MSLIYLKSTSNHRSEETYEENTEPSPTTTGIYYVKLSLFKAFANCNYTCCLTQSVF